MFDACIDKHMVKMNTERNWMRRHFVAAFLFHVGWWTSRPHSVFPRRRLNILPGLSSLLFVFQYLSEPSCSGLTCRFVAFLINSDDNEVW